MTLKLSVLDQSPIREGGTAAQALAETIELAQLADRLGYHRYWVAEHHNTESFAGSAQEVMVAKLAAETDRIRVGSGGVMMTHYAPLKVAETFRVLHTLAPGRIDLGVGRAPGSDLRTMAALQPGPERYGPHVYPQQIQLVKDLLADASGEAPLGESHPFYGIRARPVGPGSPELWILGSGPDSAEVAAVTGHPFAYAHFIVGDGGTEGIGGVETMIHYRRRFVPSPTCPAPLGMVGVAAIVAESDEEAERLSSSVVLWAARGAMGERTPFPSIETALAHEFTDAEKAIIAGRERRVFVGTPEKVRDQLIAKADDYGAQELAVVTITYDHSARIKSYELAGRSVRALIPGKLAQSLKPFGFVFYEPAVSAKFGESNRRGFTRAIRITERRAAKRDLLGDVFVLRFKLGLDRGIGRFLKWQRFRALIEKPHGAAGGIVCDQRFIPLAV